MALSKVESVKMITSFSTGKSSSQNAEDNKANKKIEIYTKPIGSDTIEKYVGTVVGCYSTGESFLVLDTKELNHNNFNGHFLY